MAAITEAFTFVARVAFPPCHGRSRVTASAAVTIGASIFPPVEKGEGEEGEEKTTVRFWAEDDGPLTSLKAWRGVADIASDAAAASLSGGAFTTVDELTRYLTSLGKEETEDNGGALPPAPRAVPVAGERGDIAVVFTVPASGFFGEKTFVVTLTPVSLRGAVRNAAITSCALARKYEAMVGGPSCQFRFSFSSPLSTAVHFSDTKTAFSIRHPVHPRILSRWYATERDYLLAVRQAVLDYAIEPWRTRMITFILDGEREGDGSTFPSAAPVLPSSLMELALASAPPITISIAIGGGRNTRCEVVFETRAGGPLPFIGVTPSSSSGEEDGGVWIDGESGARHPASSPFDALRKRRGGGEGGGCCTLYKVEFRGVTGGDGRGGEGEAAAAAVRFSINYEKTEWFNLPSSPSFSAWSIRLVPNWNSRVELLGHLCRYTQRQ